MSEEGGRTEPLEELPFPGRRARPIHEVREPFGGSRDPLSGTQFSSLQETPPQHEVVARAEASRRRGGDRIPKFPTLETMYAAFPDVARIGKLRVVRIEPQWWNDGYTGQRVRVNGILGYHEKPISTQEISKMYGGYKYQVFGMLEQTDREDFGGPPKLVDVAFAEFTLPVDPVPEARPVEGEDEMHSPWPFFGGRRGVPQGVPQQSGGDMTPLLAWAERMARGNGSQSAPSDTIFQTVARQGEMTAHQVREMAQAQISSLERQNETLREKMELIESRFHDKPTDIVSLTQAVAALNQSSRTSASSDELKTIQEQHDREMARIKEDHRSDLDRLSRERDREVDRTRVDAEARVERAEDRIKELRESFERKERDLRDDFERRERSARDEAKRTLDAMKQSYETRIEEIRQLHDRELRLHMSMQENTARTAETAHGVELRSLQNDLAKLSAELGSKQQLVDVHMAEQNRPLLDRVNEIRGMAEALGIGADKEMPAVPIGDSAPLHEKLLTLLVSQADKLLPQLTALVKKPEGQAPMTATQVQQAQMQQAQMFQQQDPRALPPRRVQRMTFADSDGPRLRSYDDLPGSGSPSPEERDEMPPTSYASSGPRPYQPPSFGDPGMPPRADSRRVQQQVSANDMMMAQQAQIQQQQAQIQQMQQQPQQQMRPATPMQKPQMVPAAQPMSSPSDVVRKQEPEEPWSHFAWIPGVPKDEVVGLATTLMQACAQKVEPTALVKAFVDQHGPEVVSMIPTIIDLGKFIESVRSDPATRATVLATGRGRRYLEDVWKCILETGESMTVEDAETKETESEAPEGVESPQPSEEPD